MRYIAVVCGHELKCLRSNSICYRTAPRDFSPFRVIKLLRAVLCLHNSICYFMRSAKTRQPIPSGILSYNSYEQKKTTGKQTYSTFDPPVTVSCKRILYFHPFWLRDPFSPPDPGSSSMVWILVRVTFL